jgi:hypothetical protein
MTTLFNKDHTQRVIVGPHGLYIAQRSDHSHGCKASPAIMDGKKVVKPAIPHNDPWKMIQRPTPDLMLAKQQAGIES